MAWARVPGVCRAGPDLRLQRSREIGQLCRGGVERLGQTVGVGSDGLLGTGLVGIGSQCGEVAPERRELRRQAVAARFGKDSLNGGHHLVRLVRCPLHPLGSDVGRFVDRVGELRDRGDGDTATGFERPRRSLGREIDDFLRVAGGVDVRQIVRGRVELGSVGVEPARRDGKPEVAHIAPCTICGRAGLWRPYVEPPSLEMKLSASFRRVERRPKAEIARSATLRMLATCSRSRRRRSWSISPQPSSTWAAIWGRWASGSRKNASVIARGRCCPAQIDQSELVGRRLELADGHGQPRRLVSRNQGAEHDEPEPEQRQLLELGVQGLDQVCQKVFSAHRSEQRPEDAPSCGVSRPIQSTRGRIVPRRRGSVRAAGRI